MTVDESVALAGLCRALVVHLAAAVRAGTPWREPRPEMLRAALWRAARHGTTGHLIDVEAGCERPAAEAVRMLLERLREPLEAHGDHELVHEGVERILRDGTGAERQRRARARRDRREDVVDLLVTATTA